MEETNGRESLDREVTSRIIVDIEDEQLPWVQPWEAADYFFAPAGEEQ